MTKETYHMIGQRELSRFFNIGDATVMVASLTFSPLVGGIAGGIGSTLADALGGWHT